MQIIGLQKNSFVDFPTKIACVVFTPGCNFNCWYCHNREIINQNEGAYDESAVLSFLKKREGFLDGVVITGGEATLQPDLKDFAKKIKDLGFLVKLDTNGTNPKVLKELIDEKLIDYVAMDLKAPFDKYNIITVVNDLDNIKESVEILKSHNIGYEFRTTFAPNLTNEDIKSLLEDVSPIKTFSLQKYVKPKYVDDILQNHEIADFEDIKSYALSNNLVENFLIKNID